MADVQELKNNPYQLIPANVIDQLRKTLPINSNLKHYILYSLKKAS